jgi:hypothetical protein
MSAILLTGPSEDLKSLIPLFERLGLSVSYPDAKTPKAKKKPKAAKKPAAKKIMLTRHLERIMQEDGELLQKLA